MIRLQLPFPPTTNNLFANGKRGRYRTKQYINWMHAADNEATAQGQESIRGPVRLKILLGAPDNRRRDCSNYIKALEDWLVSREYIEADDISIVKEVSIAWAEVEGALVEVLKADRFGDIMGTAV